MAWLTGWRYRRPITIDNTQNSNDLTDYQISVTVDTASLIQQGKMQADGDDIRFTDTDGTTLLPYWLEGPINDANTKIWVKVPSIPAQGTKVIYFYYGNPTASSESSIADTFIREIDGALPLKACWHMDEGSGGTVYDNSGNGNDGTIYGATWTNSGRFGKALDFDGVDDYVQIPNGASLNFSAGEGWTFRAWVKTSDSYGVIISFRDSVNDNPVIDLAVGYNGAATNVGHFIPLMRYDNGSGLAYFSSTMNIADNLWHHVAFIYNPSLAKIFAYVDGYVWERPQTAQGSITTSDDRAIGRESRWVRTGHGNPDRRYLAGTIDEVLIFKRALTSEEIFDIYNHYAYTTLNYAGRVLVRKRIDPEPTTSVGNEETSEAPIIIAQRRLLIIGI